MSYLPRSLSSFITAAYGETVNFTLTGTSGTISMSAVPAGTIRVITNVCGWNNNGASGRHRLRANVGGANCTLRYSLSPARYEGIDVQTPIILEAGDKLDYRVNAATVGDVLYCEAVGYDIKAEST